ncbi:DMT family transporter [uncultured Clostridium sp.]|uniref:DMT family transporter n=1 Tax=uncultured Clostridium sp. TaxID=59620 RepID=UPI0025DBD479|nr:EamA family transporter [uncultured Clostridium sp.]
MEHKIRSAKFMNVTAMAAFGTIGIFVAQIPLSSEEIAFFRAAIAIAVIFAWQLVRGRKFHLPGSKKSLILLMVSGAMIGFNWIFLFEAYRYTSVSVATLSYYFAPVIVTAVCPFLFHERPSLRQMICFIFSTAGLVLVISAGGFSGGSSNITGVGYGLAAAALYAGIILINKSLPDIEGIDRTFLQFIVGLIVMFPYVLFKSGFHVAEAGAFGILNLLILGVVHTGIGYCLYFSSLKDLKGQEAAILSYIDPLVACLMSVFVLGETMSLMQIAGGLMILGFTLYNELGGAYGKTGRKVKDTAAGRNR